MVQGLVLRQRSPQRIVRIYAGDREGFGVEIGSLERRHMSGYGLFWMQSFGIVHPRNDGGDFQQRVGFWIEASCFHIDDHGQETAEALCDEGFWREFRRGLWGGFFHGRKDNG